MRWNCNKFLISECAFPSMRGRFFPAPEVAEAQRRPGFVHFAGRKKPWSEVPRHPHRELYQRYRSSTLWAGPGTQPPVSPASAGPPGPPSGPVRD